LDLGCGTGRLLLPLRERGYSVSGLDRSPHMLQRLEEKAEAQSIPMPSVIRGDVESVVLPRDHYGGVFCMHNTFGELAKTLVEAERVLGLVRDALLPEGWFLIEMDNPRLKFSHWINPLRGRDEQKDIVVEEHFELVEYQDLSGYAKFEDVMKIYECGELVKERKVFHAMRFWTPDEIRLLCMRFGFEDVRLIGSDCVLDRDAVSGTGYFILCRAKKKLG